MFKLCPSLAAGTTFGLLSVAIIAQLHGTFNRHMAERTQVLTTHQLCFSACQTISKPSSCTHVDMHAHGPQINATVLASVAQLVAGV